jgi:hypothetical protein
VKKTWFFISLLFLTICQNAAPQQDGLVPSPAQYGDENAPSGQEAAGFSLPLSGEKPVAFIFSEGLTASWLTRIIKQTDRSNFVFKDFLPGLYFGVQMANFKPLNPMIRLAAFYPLSSSFNKIPQPPKSPLHFGIDFFGGADFEVFSLKYVRIYLSPGLHLFFLNSDRWNYLNLGVAGLTRVELPLTGNWTILLNGMASLDNGNLGANRRMEPFDIVYQYQVDFGVRYSKKLSNAYSYIPGREPPK